MNILIHNPIAQMYGPYFLLVYAAVILSTLVGCVLVLRDRTSDQGLSPISNHPIPDEIAYLRGGQEEVLKLVCLDLLQKGYLTFKDNKFSQGDNSQNTSFLTPLSRQVFDFFGSSGLFSQLKSDQSVQVALKDYCLSYKQSLEEQGLFRLREKNEKVLAIALLIILGLGGYKFSIALATGHHNVGFLILFAVLGIIFLGMICLNYSSRLTDKGKDYLHQLQQAFKNLNPNESDYNTQLLVAIFGDKVLNKTEYKTCVKNFSSATYSYTNSSSTSTISSSNCGSSCSSSGSSCSSSGSSCGGCGSSCGGGCGGCGG